MGRPIPGERPAGRPPSEEASEVSAAGADSGTLYGIGLGPGDPELITVKGLRLLRSATVVFLPVRRVGATSFAGQIASPYLDAARQELVPLVYPTARGQAPAVAQWEANADTIATQLAGGRVGAFLTEGDPLLYSTFAHALLPLRARHPAVRVEIVPGVWSGSAAAAAVGEPLIDGAERLAVLPAAYGEDAIGRALREYDTVVLLKPGPDVGALHGVLAAAGARAVWVQRVGRPEERIARDLAGLQDGDVDYFSLIIARAGAGRGARAEAAPGAGVRP